MDEMLEWIFTIDRSTTKRKHLHQFIKERQQQQQQAAAAEEAAEGETVSSIMCLCHLYMLLYCPQLRSTNSTTTTVDESVKNITLVPLIQQPVLHLSHGCTPIVLTSTEDHTTKDPGTTTTTTPARSQHRRPPQFSSTTTTTSSTVAPDFIRTSIPTPVKKPDQEELTIVTTLIKEKRTIDLLTYAIIQGRVASVQDILQGSSSTTTAAAAATEGGRPTLEELLHSGDTRVDRSGGGKKMC